MQKQPTLFLPHGGGPCFFMEWTLGPADTWDKLAAWLGSVLNSLPQRPAAFLIVSAHWETSEIQVTGNPHPELIFDYSGFPPHTYELQYPVQGAPMLAEEIRELLSDAGIGVSVDPTRGLDHGVFVPFKLVAPDADIPVVQLSLRSDLDPRHHLSVGAALAPLRDRNILIVGSGLSSHNLRAMMTPDTPSPESANFNDWLVAVCEGAAGQRLGPLTNWHAAPGARSTHPREEHLLPLMVCAGAAKDDPGRCVFRDEVMGAHAVAIQFG